MSNDLSVFNMSYGDDNGIGCYELTEYVVYENFPSASLSYGNFDVYRIPPLFSISFAEL